MKTGSPRMARNESGELAWRSIAQLKEPTGMKVLETPQPDERSTTTVGIRLMAATLSRELRTPLNAIVGSIALLERQLTEGSHDRVHIDRLKRNSRHLAAMLDDVLERVRAESGQFAVSLAKRRLRGIVDEALANIELRADDRRVAMVNMVPGAGASPVYWDPVAAHPAVPAGN